MGSGQSEIDVLKWTGRTALELIGQGGLGYSFDPLEAETEAINEYGNAVKLLLCVCRSRPPFTDEQISASV